MKRQNDREWYPVYTNSSTKNFSEKHYSYQATIGASSSLQWMQEKQTDVAKIQKLLELDEKV